MEQSKCYKKLKSVHDSAVVTKPTAKAKAKSKGKAKAKPQAPTEAAAPTAVACEDGPRGYLWLDDMVACITFAAGNDVSNIDADIIEFSVRTALVFAFQEKVKINGTEYSRWSGLRAYLQKFVSAACATKGKPDGDDSGAAKSGSLPMNIVELRKLINSVEPDNDEQELGDDHQDAVPVLGNPECEAMVEKFSKAAMTQAMETLSGETIAALANFASSFATPLRFQPGALAMASSFIGSCTSVQTHRDLADAMRASISGMIGTDAWHSLQMMHYEISATGTCTTTQPLVAGTCIYGSGFTGNDSVAKLMKTRVDISIYLVKTLCDCDDEEWPFTSGAHIAKPSLAWSLFFFLCFKEYESQVTFFDKCKAPSTLRSRCHDPRRRSLG